MRAASQESFLKSGALVADNDGRSHWELKFGKPSGISVDFDGYWSEGLTSAPIEELIISSYLHNFAKCLQVAREGLKSFFQAPGFWADHDEFSPTKCDMRAYYEACILWTLQAVSDCGKH